MFFKFWTRDQLVLWLGKNFRILVIFFGIAVLIAVGVLIWNWQKKELEYKARVSLYKAQQSLKALVKDEDKIPSLKDEKTEKKLVLTKEMEQKALFYEKAVKQNKKFQTAVLFAIDLADFYYRYEEKEKAKELLSLFALPLESHSVYHLAVFQLANYYMSDKKCEKALPLFSQLSSNEKASAFHSEVSLQKALCLEAMNRYKSALKEYEKLEIENPESYIGSLAKDYKRMLVLKEKLKK